MERVSFPGVHALAPGDTQRKKIIIMTTFFFYICKGENSLGGIEISLEE